MFRDRTWSKAAGAAVLIGSVAGGLIGAGPAGAADPPDFTVTTGANSGPGSYRAAIAAASSADGFRIAFTPGITVSLTADVVYTGAGDLDLAGLGSGATIDGNGAHQILDAGDPTLITIQRLTLRDGQSDDDGGAIDAPLAQVNIRDSTFSGNTAVGDGGAINTGDEGVFLDTVRFTDNEATTGDGGAIRTDFGSSVAEDSTFSGNTAGDDGGAWRAAGGTLQTESSTFNGNTAADNGGAIRGATTQLDLVDSTFSGNTASGGGAVSNPDGLAGVADVTASGNSATSGSFLVGGVLSIVGSVVTDSAGPGASCQVTTTSNDEHSYEEGDDSCGLDDPSSTENAPDPLLLPLASYGGPTQTHLPAPGSPLIEAYEPAEEDSCISRSDQRSVERPQDGDADTEALCDIGAVEVRPQTFTDVPETNPFFGDIEWMAAEEISTGFQPGPTFRPGQAVTRQAMSAFMYRLAGSPAFADPSTPVFVDVPNSHPFNFEIEWMADEGITTGFPGGLFKPSDPVTRASMSAFLFRFAGSPDFDDPPTATFNDVATTSQFFTEIEWMAAEGITTGFQPGPSYRPNNVVTRQAMAAFMFRFTNGLGD